MNIAVASIYNEAIIEMAEITVNQNKRSYCDRHGYTLKTKTKDFPCKDIGFAKIHFLLDILKSNNYDWVFWCGADTLITNPQIKLESLIDENYHLIVTCDIWDWNLDCFFVRNSEKCIKFLEKIISQYDDYIDEDGKPRHLGYVLKDGGGAAWAEQGAVILEWKEKMFIPEVKSEYKNFVKELPQKSMNSYLYHVYPSPYHQKGLDYKGRDGSWAKGDFMLHMPGLPNEFRMQVLKQISDLI